MTTSAEQGPKLEIFSVTEADAYIRAANMILSQDAAEIYGLEHSYRIKPNGQPEPFVRGYVETHDYAGSEQEVVRFETAAVQTAKKKEVSIGQFVGSDKENDWQVVRSFKVGASRPEYIIAKPKGFGKSKLVISISEDVQTAEALFVTMTTDFKAQIDAKLIDRTDLRDGIEWYANNLPDFAKLSRSRRRGRAILRAY